MQDWHCLVEAYHELAHPDGLWTLVKRDGASNSDLRQLERKLGQAFPDEFQSFYRACDGFGISPIDNEGKVIWFCVPLSEIPDFVERTRETFCETHPILASQFFPFIDWNCGDGSGYVTDSAGVIQPGLFTFEHELYGGDSVDDPEEFVSFLDETIEDVLRLNYM